MKNAQNFIDLTGKKFGRWTVIAINQQSDRKRLTWLCLCDCGTEKAVNGGSLRRGLSRSCGCYNQDVRCSRHSKFRKHGLSQSETYQSWRAMHSRCRRANHRDWKNYGGRGIEVCPEWKAFEVFLRDMGERPEGATLDRIDPDGRYGPENCRWASSAIQGRNRRNNRRLTVDGVTRCVNEWAELSGTGASTIRERLKRGWNSREAVFSPPLPKGLAVLHPKFRQMQKSPTFADAESD